MLRVKYDTPLINNICPIIGLKSDRQRERLTRLYGDIIVIINKLPLPTDIIGVIFSFFCKDHDHENIPVPLRSLMRSNNRYEKCPTKKHVKMIKKLSLCIDDINKNVEDLCRPTLCDPNNYHKDSKIPLAKYELDKIQYNISMKEYKYQLIIVHNKMVTELLKYYEAKTNDIHDENDKNAYLYSIPKLKREVVLEHKIIPINNQHIYLHNDLGIAKHKYHIALKKERNAQSSEYRKCIRKQSREMKRDLCRKRQEEKDKEENIKYIKSLKKTKVYTRK